MNVGIYYQSDELFNSLGVLLMDMDFEPVRLNSPAESAASDSDIYIFEYEAEIESHLTQLRESSPNALILVTGLSDLKSAVAVSHSGASDIFGEKIDLMHLSRLLTAARDRMGERDKSADRLEEITREAAITKPEPEENDPKAEAVARALDTHKEFAHTLLLVGAADTPFSAAIRKYVSETGFAKTEFISCASLESGQMDRIAEKLAETEIDLLVFPDLEVLSLPLQEELYNFMESDPMGDNVRMIFCCREDPLTLVEESRLNEGIYLKVARREVEVADFLKPEPALA